METENDKIINNSVKGIQSTDQQQKKPTKSKTKPLIETRNQFAICSKSALIYSPHLDIIYLLSCDFFFRLLLPLPIWFTQKCFINARNQFGFITMLCLIANLYVKFVYAFVILNCLMLFRSRNNAQRWHIQQRFGVWMKKGVKIVFLVLPSKTCITYIQIKIEFPSNVIHWRQQINKI